MIKLLTIDELCAMTQRSESSLYGDIRRSNFPPPIRLGNGGPRSPSRWREADIITWLDARPVGVASERVKATKQTKRAA